MPRAAKYEHGQHVQHHNPMSGAPAHYYQSRFPQSPFFQNGSPSSASTSSPRSPQAPLSPPSSQASSAYSQHQKSSLSQSSIQSSPQEAQPPVQNHSQPAQHQMSPLPSILSLTSVPLTGASAPPRVQLGGPAKPKTSRVTVDENGKKRHECDRCDRTFTTSGHLARHARTHTGERNHKCPFPGCETACSRQDNLQQHYRIHLSPGSRRSATRAGRGKGLKRASTASSSISSASTSAGSPSVASISAGGSSMHTFASRISTGSNGQEASPDTKSKSPPARIDTPPPPLEEARPITGADGALYYPGTGQHMVTPPDTPPALTHATLPATASLASLNLPMIMGMQPHSASQGTAARATASPTTKTSQAQAQVPAEATSPTATSQAGSVASQSSQQHQAQYQQQQAQTAASVSSAHSSPKAQYSGSASNDTLPLLTRALNYRYIGHGSLYNSVAQPTSTHMPSQQQTYQVHQQQQQEHSPQIQQEPTASSIAAYSHSHLHQQPPHSYSQHSSPDPSRTVASNSVSHYAATHQEVPSYSVGMPPSGLEPTRGPSPFEQQHQQQQFTSRHSISHISHPHPHPQMTHVQSTPSLMGVSSGGASISSISSASSSVGSTNLIPSGMVGPASPAMLPSRRTPPTQSYSAFQSMQQQQQQQQQMYGSYSQQQQHYPSQSQPQQQLPLLMQPLSASGYTSHPRYTTPPLAETSAPTRISSPAPILAPLFRSGDPIGAVMARQKYTSASAGSSMSWDVDSETRYSQVAARYAQESRYGGQQQHYQHQQQQQQVEQHQQAQQQAAAQQYQQQQVQRQQQQVQQQQQHQAQQQQYSSHSQYQAQHAQQHHVQHQAHVQQQQQQDSPYVQQHPSADYVSYHSLGHGAWKGDASGLRSVGAALG